MRSRQRRAIRWLVGVALVGRGSWQRLPDHIANCPWCLVALPSVWDHSGLRSFSLQPSSAAFNSLFIGRWLSRFSGIDDRVMESGMAITGKLARSNGLQPWGFLAWRIWIGPARRSLPRIRPCRQDARKTGGDLGSLLQHVALVRLDHGTGHSRQSRSHRRSLPHGVPRMVVAGTSKSLDRGESDFGPLDPCDVDE